MTETTEDDFAVVDWKTLKSTYGWPYSRVHTWRMMAAGDFPQCFKLGSHRNSHPVWSRKRLRQFFRNIRGPE